MSKVEKLAQQIAQLKPALKQKEKTIGALETKLQTSRGKNSLLATELKKVNKGLVLQPIKGHKYTDFIGYLSVQLYGQLHCGFRGVVKIRSLLKALQKAINQGGSVATLPVFVNRYSASM